MPDRSLVLVSGGVFLLIIAGYKLMAYEAEKEYHLRPDEILAGRRR